MFKRFEGGKILVYGFIALESDLIFIVCVKIKE
jgi:hypothetical protein